MKVKYVSPSEVESVLDSSNGRFMTVVFVTRGDNTVRTMNCRKGVKKGIKGTGKDRKRSGLYTVYDMVVKGWRTINVSGIHKINMNGTEYRVRV